MRRILFAILLAMTTVATQAQVFDFNEVDCGPEATTFQLFAPATAKRVVVRIYKDGIGKVKPSQDLSVEASEKWCLDEAGER